MFCAAAKKSIRAKKKIDGIIIFGSEENSNPIHGVDLWQKELKEKGCKRFFITGGIGRGTKGLINVAPLSYPNAIKLKHKDGFRYIKFNITGREKPVYDFYIPSDVNDLRSEFKKDGLLTKHVTEGDIYLEAALDRLINVYGYKKEDICILNEFEDFSKYGFVSKENRKNAKLTIFLENGSVTTLDNTNRLKELIKKENIDISTLILVHNPITQARGEQLVGKFFLRYEEEVDYKGKRKFLDIDKANLHADITEYNSEIWNKIAPMSYTSRRFIYNEMSDIEKIYILKELCREIDMTIKFLTNFSYSHIPELKIQILNTAQNCCEGDLKKLQAKLKKIIGVYEKLLATEHGR
ncbi:hypothetical protein ACFL5N_00195 [bacterium]